ncbi:12298_t:CDS:2, partial [Funneliformis geosporum]
CNTTIQSIFDAKNEEVEVMVISVMQRLTETVKHDGINKNDILQDK